MLSVLIFFTSIDVKIFFIIGILSSQVFYPSIDEVPSFFTESFAGTVISPPKYTVPGRVLIDFKTKYGVYECRGKDLPWRNSGRIKEGDVISVFASYKKIQISRNPFTYDGKLFHEGKIGTCKILFNSIEKDHQDSSAQYIRESMKAKVNMQEFSLDVKGLLLGMTIGDTSELTTAVSEIFKQTGLYHLIVVSGFQLVLIFSVVKQFVTFLLRFVGLPLVMKRILTTVIPILLTYFYSLLCGSSPATERALIALMLTSVFFLLERESSALTITCGTMLLSLIISPGLLFSPSFHLTFAALFGLTLGNAIGKKRKNLIAVVTASLSTSVVSFFWFEGGSYLSPLYNLIFAPIFSFFTTLCGLLGLLLSFADDGLVLSIVGFITEILFKIIEAFSHYQVSFSISGAWWYQGVLLYLVVSAARGFLRHRYISVLWRKRGASLPSS